MMVYEASTNLITNSSFEDKNNPTVGWTMGDWNGSTGAWRIANDGVTGANCIECYNSDNKTDGSATNSVAYQKITIPSGQTLPQTYTISTYAKRIGSTQPNLSIQCYDSNNNAISGAYWLYYGIYQKINGPE